MNIRMIARFVSMILKTLAAFMLPSLILAVVDGDRRSFFAFSITILICVVGFLLLKLIKGDHRPTYVKDGFVVVAISWIILSIFGALPFWISGEIPSFLDALFESTSGFTTTGMTVLLDVESLPRSTLLWRSITHWIGGMGVLVFLLALITNMAGDKNINLMRAESPGPSPGKLVPKLRQSSKILYIIYLSLTVLEICFLFAGGMPLFDSICHAMGTAGTGGFAIKNASISAYGNFYFEMVITVFMILFGINFNIYYLLIIRSFAAIRKNEELWMYLGIMATAMVLVAINITGTVYRTIGESLRYSSFQVASIMTTTGFGTADIDVWPTFSKAVLLLLMFIGGSAGSTSGGIKVSRIMLLVREAKRGLHQITQPRSVEVVKLDGKAVDKTVINSVNAYFIVYMLLFFASFLIVSLDGHEFTSIFSSVASCFNNIGRSFGGLDPASNFADFSPVSKIVLCIDMLLGRLEIYPIVMLCSPRTWKRV